MLNGGLSDKRIEGCKPAADLDLKTYRDFRILHILGVSYQSLVFSFSLNVVKMAAEYPWFRFVDAGLEELQEQIEVILLRNYHEVVPDRLWGCNEAVVSTKPHAV